MSKIGNYRIGLQETDDYQFGQQSAERGEPMPNWPALTNEDHYRLSAQIIGWQDYHTDQVSA